MVKNNMQTTSLSCLDNEEILVLVDSKEELTDLEIELSQRLQLALDLLEEHGLDS